MLTSVIKFPLDPVMALHKTESASFKKDRYIMVQSEQIRYKFIVVRSCIIYASLQQFECFYLPTTKMAMVD